LPFHDLLRLWPIPPGAHREADTIDIHALPISVERRATQSTQPAGPLFTLRARAIKIVVPRCHQLRTAAVNRPARWIWVHHAPPAGTRICKTARGDYGDSNLTQWIDRWRPEMVICGHIHQAPWVDGGGWFDRRGQTWVFNAGHEIGHEPAHIVIDLTSREATWVGVPDEEKIAL
jgi:hypothetical protein